MNQKTKGILLIVTSSISFGIIPILAKLSYGQGGNPFNVLFFRFVFAAAMMFIYLRIKHISIYIPKKQLVFIFALGVAGYSGTALCLFLSYKYISTGLATMILYLYPGIVSILSLFVYGERLYAKKIISLIISIFGIYLLIGLQRGYSIDFRGIFLALLAAIFYSIYVMGLSSKIVSDVNSFTITFYVSLISGIVLFIVGTFNSSISINISLLGFICIILLALISTVLALITFAQGVKIVGPSNAAIFSNLEPIVSLVLSYIIFHDKITISTLLGSFFIILSILILSIDKKQMKKVVLLKDNTIDK